MGNIMILKKFKIVNKDKKHYDIEFIIDTRKEIQYPYCSVIIGANGTGKSFLLSQIAHFVANWNDKKYKYQYSNYFAEYNNDTEDNIKAIAENYRINNNNNPDIRILAVSFLVNDKFESRAYYRKDNYKYLGIRHASNGAAYRENIEKLIIGQLLSKKIDNYKKQFICKILRFLELEERIELKISLSPRYHPDFAKTKKTSMNLIKEKIDKELYAKYKIKTKYQKILENLGKEGIEKIIKFLEKIYEVHEYFILTNVFTINVECNDGYFINLLEHKNDITEQMFDILLGLEFISDEILTLYKNDKQFMFKWAASGEKQLFYTLINIYSNITQNSLILIDEPETSLHPNWQMKYIGFLKEVFDGYKCHFIIATHSPHLISDLAPCSSSVIVLNRDQKGVITANPYPVDTYAWSVENILYNVFRVRTTRNYYFESDLNNLTSLLANNENMKDNKKKIQKLYKKLNSYMLDDNDPLKKFLKDLENINVSD